MLLRKGADTHSRTTSQFIFVDLPKLEEFLAIEKRGEGWMDENYRVSCLTV